MTYEAQLRRMVATAADTAWTLALMCRTPMGKELLERMRNPRPGDVVLETSTVWRWRRDPEGEPGDALGTLVRRVGSEWTSNYLVLPHGAPADAEPNWWENATFIAVPGVGEGWR